MQIIVFTPQRSFNKLDAEQPPSLEMHSYKEYSVYNLPERYHSKYRIIYNEVQKVKSKVG